LWELGVHKSRSFQFGDMLALRFQRLGLTKEQQILKRFIDITLSLLAVTVLFIPMAFFAAVIFLQDRCNPIYAQERLTKNGRVFRLYKLRTMIPNAEQGTGPVLAAYNDHRITRAGRFLRLMRLDEIPQFINVLKGDMSIVGPRPERPVFHELYSLTVPDFAHRLKVRAGITGMAHVYGRYDSRPEERIRLDIHYISNFSVLLDIKIMVETVRVMLSRSYADGLKNKHAVSGSPRPSAQERRAETTRRIEMERVW
jgi:lipopolysaccharide/colanic/teichoic acid biosynthesis glycosyltransferase